MPVVDESEVDAIIVGMALSGWNIKEFYFWNYDKKKHDIPILVVTKEKEYIKKRKVTVTYGIRTRFRGHGRSKDMYVQWPKIFWTNSWDTSWLEKYGFLVSATYQNPTDQPYGNILIKEMILESDYGKARYELLSEAKYGQFSKLVEYEGTMRRPR